MTPEKAQTCRNAMEFLVAEELDKQLKRIPSRLAKYLNAPEISAFALNRLPALYATSEKGWRQQCLKGRRDHGEQIMRTVHKGILAVQNDPLRLEKPLAPAANQEVEKALDELKKLLHCEELSWQNLSAKVKESLSEAGLDKSELKRSVNGASERHSWQTAYYRY